MKAATPEEIHVARREADAVRAALDKRRRAFLHALCDTEQWPEPERLHACNHWLHQPADPSHARRLRNITPFELPSGSLNYEASGWIVELERRFDAGLVGVALAFHLHDQHGVAVERLRTMKEREAYDLLAKRESARAR